MSALKVWAPGDFILHDDLNGNFALVGGTPPALTALLARTVTHVAAFGAVGDGLTDDTAAIQAAINAAGHGDVAFGPLTYKITSSVVIGNGGSTAASTMWGVRLIGQGAAPFPAEVFTGFPGSGGTKLLWSGAPGGTMIQVAGPLNGWAVQNMYLDGNLAAAIGVNVASASFGGCSHVAITNCTGSAIVETTFASFEGFALANSMHNAYGHLAISVPNVAGATGITLTGQPLAVPAAANSCYGQFSNVMIALPAAAAAFGVRLAWCDSVTFEVLHIFGGPASTPVVFDYTVQNNLPSSCSINGSDVSGGALQIANLGSPGAGARPNFVRGLGQINNARIPRLANLVADLPYTIATIDQIGVSAPISNVILYTPYETGMFRLSSYLRLTTAGTAGTLNVRLTVNDGVSPVNNDLPGVAATGGANFGEIVVRASGGVPFNYSVVYIGVSGTPVYNVMVNCERIG